MLLDYENDLKVSDIEFKMEQWSIYKQGCGIFTVSSCGIRFE